MDIIDFDVPEEGEEDCYLSSMWSIEPSAGYTMMGGKQMKILRECETFVKTLIVNFDKKRV